MKRKQLTAPLSDPTVAKRQKREQQQLHYDFDTVPPTPTATATPSPGWSARTDSLESFAQPSDCWSSSASGIHSTPDILLPLLRRSSSLPNLSDLRSLPRVARLSKQNIRAMSAKPLTPAQSYTSSKSRSQASPSKSSTSSLNPAQAAERLTWADIFDEDAGEEALALRPVLRDKIQQIVDGHRGSSMKPDSVHKFRVAKKHMASRNEATIAARLMPFLIKAQRRVSQRWEDVIDLADLAVHSNAAAPETLSRSFETDGLDWNISAPFHGNSVPIPFRLSHSMQTSTELGVKVPTPDLTYGFQQSEFSSDQLRLLSQSGLEVAKDIVSPFFVVEWKAWRGSLLEAKVQARRAGAAMVWGRRRARAAVCAARGRLEDVQITTHASPSKDLEATGVVARAQEPFNSPVKASSSADTRTQHDEDTSAAGIDTIAFSCVISPDVVFFYVHWADDSTTSPTDTITDRPLAESVLPQPSSIATNPLLLQRTKYHTALLTKHFLDATSVPRIRACMHNILDWGLEQRKSVVKKEAGVLVEVEAQEMGRARGEGRGIEEREGKRRKL